MTTQLPVGILPGEFPFYASPFGIPPLLPLLYLGLQ